MKQTFKATVGSKQGSGGITATSINLSQQDPSELSGLKIGTKMKGSAAGRVDAEGGVGNGFKAPSGTYPK